MDLGHQEKINIKVEKGKFFKKLYKIFSIKENNKILIANNTDENQEIIKNIKNAKSEWVNANTNFDYADDQELVDYYTYKIKACQVRYEYFIRKAKEKGITLDSADAVQMICSGDHINY